MDRLLHIFSDPNELQLIFFVLLLLVCWNIENVAGLVSGYKKWRHAFTNSKFVFTNIPLQFVMGILCVKTMQWTAAHHFGILYSSSFFQNGVLQVAVTFIILDFGEFIYHVIMHKVKRCWMFHLVHHSDNIVDVSTTLREHPIENLIRNTFTLFWIFLSGCVFWPLLVRQLIQVCSNIFAHMNYRLPEKLDRVLSVIFITPNLHHVHHHYQQPYTDKNYGDVLSIWDRMFGTFCRLPASKVLFGVDVYMEAKENSKFYPLMKIPFGKYRNPKTIFPETIQGSKVADTFIEDVSSKKRLQTFHTL